MQVRAHPQINMVALTRRIEPLPGELNDARRHLTTVKRRLASSFEVSKIMTIGSHGRGTAIRSHSDLDVMAVLRRNEAKWGGSLIASSTFLGKVRDYLVVRYVQTDVRGDRHAVVLQFAGGQQGLDVVPALFLKFDRGWPVYSIADGHDGWLQTSPESHNRYFDQKGEKTRGKLKKTIQLLKWWKHSRAQSIPILSFHLDLLVAQSEICVGVKPYTQCLHEAFSLLADRECRGLQDPIGIAGTVYAAQTDAQWKDINNAVRYALVHATAARIAEGTKKWEEANRQWDIVFNGSF